MLQDAQSGILFAEDNVKYIIAKVAHVGVHGDVRAGGVIDVFVAAHLDGLGRSVCGVAADVR